MKRSLPAENSKSRPSRKGRKPLACAGARLAGGGAHAPAPTPAARTPLLPAIPSRESAATAGLAANRSSRHSRDTTCQRDTQCANYYLPHRSHLEGDQIAREQRATTAAERRAPRTREPAPRFQDILCASVSYPSGVWFELQWPRMKRRTLSCRVDGSDIVTGESNPDPNPRLSEHRSHFPEVSTTDCQSRSR